MNRTQTKRKKKFRWIKWVLLAIPIFFILAGTSIILIFGWDMTKSSVNLARTVVFPYRPDHQPKEFQTDYWSTLPKPGQDIGVLSIDDLELSYPIVQGTRDEELDSGIGHLMGTLLPGQGGHTVLSGHRDTVFRKLEHLEIGDEITFESPYGDFVYEVTGFDIVEPGNTEVSKPKDHESMTLTTCYPFDYIGAAPERFIVYTDIKTMPNE